MKHAISNSLCLILPDVSNRLFSVRVHFAMYTFQLFLFEKLLKRIIDNQNSLQIILFQTLIVAAVILCAVFFLFDFFFKLWPPVPLKVSAWPWHSSFIVYHDLLWSESTVGAVRLHCQKGAKAARVSGRSFLHYESQQVYFTSVLADLKKTAHGCFNGKILFFVWKRDTWI